MKTVLLLGAGLTRASRPKISLSQRAPLDKDFFLIAKAIDSSLTEEVTSCLTSLVGNYSQTLTSSLELASTYLYIKAVDSKNGSSYHTAFLKLLTLLNKVLANTTISILTGHRSLIYRFLLDELREAGLPEKLSVITFNYDILLERVLESIDHGTQKTSSSPVVTD